MVVDEIDDALASPNLHIAWNQDPYPIAGESMRVRSMRWSVLSNGIDTGMLLVASYFPADWKNDFSLSLKIRRDFTRLDIRPAQKAVTLHGKQLSGPLFFPWQAHRPLWLNKNYKLLQSIPAPCGKVSLNQALNWFLDQYNIVQDVPQTLKLGR
jgi:hypothetical protein